MTLATAIVAYLTLMLGVALVTFDKPYRVSFGFMMIATSIGLTIMHVITKL